MYNPYMTKRKPAKPRMRAPVVTNQTMQPITHKAPRAPVRPRSFSSTAPAVQAKPAPPVLKAAPAQVTAAGPPPKTLQSESDRITLGENWGGVRGSTNAQMLDAARRYGGASNVMQYDAAGNPYNVNTTPGDVNSATAIAKENLDLSQKGTADSHASDNTFFSSRMLGDSAHNTSEYTKAMAAAKTEYETALRTLSEQLSGGRTEYNTGMRNADIYDIGQAGQATPEARSGSVNPAPSPQDIVRWITTIAENKRKAAIKPRRR